MSSKNNGILDKIKTILPFSRKKRGYNFTDEDRKRSQELRSARAELKRLKIELEKAEVMKELNNIDKEDPEDVVKRQVLQYLQMTLLGGLADPQGQASSSRGVPPAAPMAKPQTQLPKFEEISDDEIRAMIKKANPIMLAQLRSKSDEELKKIAREQFGISGQNIERAIEVLRNG